MPSSPSNNDASPPLATPMELPVPTLLDHLSRPFIPHPSSAVPSLAQSLATSLRHPISLSPLSSSSTSVLCTGYDPLDKLLSGGIPLCSQILELVGPAGAGKTQLALQLALMATLPYSKRGLDSGVVCVFTEGPPPVKRLVQMERCISSKNGLETGDLLKRIVIEKVNTPEEIVAWSEERVRYLLRKVRGRVIVVDSVAGVWRGEEAKERAQAMARMAAALKRAVWETGGGLVVAVNQVTMKLEEGRIAPALGRVWQECLEGRIFLRRKEGGRGARRIDVEASWCEQDGGMEMWIGEGGIGGEEMLG